MNKLLYNSANNIRLLHRLLTQEVAKEAQEMCMSMVILVVVVSMFSFTIEVRQMAIYIIIMVG